MKPQLKHACSFCYFVLTNYPTLDKNEMDELDLQVFTLHLEQKHGLQSEIQP